MSRVISFLCPLVPVFSLTVVKSTFCCLFNAQTLTSCNEELLISVLADMNYHLMNNSGRRLSQDFQMLIQGLVKQ